MKTKALLLVLALLLFAVSVKAQVYEFDFENDGTEYKYALKTSYDPNFGGYWLKIKVNEPNSDQLNLALVIKGTAKEVVQGPIYRSGSTLFDQFVTKGRKSKVTYDLVMHIVTKDDILASYEVVGDLVRETYYNPELNPDEERDITTALFGTQFDLLNEVIERFITSSNYVKTKVSKS